MKTCSKCNRRKKLKQFCQSNRIHSGYTSVCKLCHSGKIASWRDANRDQERATRRKWYQANLAKASAYSIKHKYGLTKGQFADLAKSQRRRCAICRKRRKLCVDHCHKTGKVRMLLCRTCNTAMGRFNDDPALLRRAASLLQNPPARRILKL